MEPYTHSFIVKVWLEETVEEAGKATWRGHITHVPSGKRCYLKSMDEIVAFILPYLEELGAKPADHADYSSWKKRLLALVRQTPR